MNCKNKIIIFDIRIFAVILHEKEQTDQNEKMIKILMEIGAAEGVSFDIKSVELNREQDDESFSNCKPKKSSFFSNSETQ